MLKPDGFHQPNVTLLLGTLAINIFSLALPIMTLQVYDRILLNPESGTLNVLIMGVCVAVVLEVVLRLCRAYVIGRVGATYEHRMACLAMSKLLHADLSRMPACGIGEYLHRFAAVGKLKDFYNGYALTTLSELAFVPLFLGLMFYIAGPLALVPLIILLLFAGVSLWRGRRLRNALLQREKADDRRFNFLIETLDGVHTLKACALEKFFERRYEAFEDDSVRANYAVTQETAATFNMGTIFSHLIVACVITIGAWCVLAGLLSTGSLVATLLLSGRIMQPVQKALALWMRYQDFTLSREHVEEMLSIPQINRKNTEGNAAIVHDGRLCLHNVGFRFSEKQPPLFQGVNLELRPGETVLIDGAHGCGKTTLLNIIAGVYPASEGTVELDGRDIAAYRPEELARHVGFIRTRPLIFRGKIRDNITCFGQNPEAQAREVAALLEVDEHVAKLPGGFDTFLSGNHTDSIPAGLRQRISMTRALAAKPHLILFDNADRSLDKEGYAMIYQLLARLKGKASMILVSDDRNIRALADNCYRLEGGILCDLGDSGLRHIVHPYKELRL